MFLGRAPSRTLPLSQASLTTHIAACPERLLWNAAITAQVSSVAAFFSNSSVRHQSNRRARKAVRKTNFLRPLASPLPLAATPPEIEMLALGCGTHWCHQEFPQPIDYFRERGHIAKLHSPNEPCPLRTLLRITEKFPRQRHRFSIWQNSASSLESLLNRFTQSRTVEIERTR